MTKHIHKQPKVNRLPNRLPTGCAQANDNESWVQVGIPLAKALSDCAQAYLERIDTEGAKQ